MKNLKKILSVLALIVLVGSDFLTSISYALEDGLEDSVVVQTESEEEMENVENEEGKIDEEDSEDAYEDESIEEEDEDVKIFESLEEESLTNNEVTENEIINEADYESLEDITDDITKNIDEDISNKNSDDKLTGNIGEENAINGDGEQKRLEGKSVENFVEEVINPEKQGNALLLLGDSKGLSGQDIVRNNKSVSQVGYFKAYDGAGSLIFGFFNKTSITSFSRNTTLMEDDVLLKPGVQEIQSDDVNYSGAKIYGWVDDNDFYWWSEADMVYFHPDTVSAFSHMDAIKTIDLNGISTELVENFAYWFDTDKVLTTIKGKINTNGVKMFDDSGVTYLETVERDSPTSQGMSFMFNDCKKLTSVDLSEFNTTNVIDMKRMFAGCESMTEIDVSNFDTHNVKTFYWMFRKMLKIQEIDVSNFDTSSGINMLGMFTASTLKTLILGENWDTSNVEIMREMFYNCTNLETIYADIDFDTSSLTNQSNMFKNDTKLVGGSGLVNETHYDSSKIGATYAKIASDYPAQNGYFTKYTTGEYTIIFENWNGAVLWSGKVGEGVVPVYSGDAPSRPSTEESVYTFTGWYPELHPATHDETYMAIYTEGTRYYTVTLTGTPAGYGTLSPESLSKEYDTAIVIDGDQLTIGGTEVTLIGNEGYEFQEWTGNCGQTTKQVCDEVIVYSHPDSIEFTGGNNIVITSEGYDLFSQSGFQKDFEISFDILSLNLSGSPKQATLLSVKNEDLKDKWPGLSFRKNGDNNSELELSIRGGSIGAITKIYKASDVHSVKISRENGKLYMAINGGNNEEVYDFAGFTNYFDKPITIGSIYQNGGYDRYIKATLSNILIKTIDTTSCHTGNVYVVTGDCQMTAKFKEIEKHPDVTVNHHWMNIGGSGYTIHETQHFTGNIGDEFTAIENEYIGFTANPENEKTIIISGDNNSNVIDLYYFRNYGYFHFLYDPFSVRNIITSCEHGDCWYGEDIQLTVVEGSGYAFNSWGEPYGISLPEGVDRTSKTISFTMPEMTQQQIKWSLSLSAIPYTITYHLNGGEETTHNQTGYTVQNPIIEVIDPVMTGYEFLGWTGGIIGGEQLDSPTTGLVIVVDDGVGNIKLGNREYYANWTPNKYEVTGSVAEGQENMGYLSGSTSTGASLTGLYEYGKELVFVAIPKIGYLFDYWEVNGKTGEDLPEESEVIDNQLKTVVNQILAIVTHFKENVGTVTVNHLQMDIGGEGYTTYETQSFTGLVGTEYTAIENAYTGFNPKGNNEKTITISADSGENIINLYYDRVGGYLNIKSNPYNSVNKYIISGCNNGTCWYGENIQITVEENTGYSFNNWDTPSGITFPDGLDTTSKTISFELSEDNNWNGGELRLFPRLTAIPYTITYYLDGGEETEHNQTSYTVEQKYPISVSDPIKTGYKFLGWTGGVINGPQLLNPTTGLVIVPNDGAGKVEVGDREYYANWEPKSYIVDVTIEPENGGTVGGTGEYKYEDLISLIATPNVDSGYQFTGWYTYEGYNKISDDYQIGLQADDSGGTGLIAKFELRNYLVHISSTPYKGSSRPQGDNYYQHGSLITVTAEPYEGYNVKNWVVNGRERKTGDNEIYTGLTLDITITNPTNIDIDFEPKPYNITYMSGNTILTGLSPNTYDIETPICDENYYNEYGTCMYYLPTLTRDGYDFTGWYNTERISSYDRIKILSGMGDRTIYAGWFPHDYDIIYHLGSGESISGDLYPEYQSYNIETPKTFIPQAQKSGYMFSGWIDKNGNSIDSFGGGMTGDMDLYTTWKPAEVNVKVNYYLKKLDPEKNELTGGVDVYRLNVNFTGLTDSTVNIIGKYYTGIEGYHYDHATVFSGSSEEIATETTILPDGSREINMYYIPNKYNFTVIQGQNTTTSGTSISTGYYFRAYVTLSGDSSDDCFGWNKWGSTDLPEGKNQQHTIFEMPAHDVTVESMVSEKSYNIIFSGNGATSGEMSTLSLQCTSGTLSKNNFERNGYTFIGWSRNSEGSVEFTGGSEVHRLSTISGGEVTLFAVWDVNHYTVTFDLNGGNLTGDMTETKDYTIETPSITLDTYIPERNGYTFTGWYKGDSLVNAIAGGETGNYTLIAKWEAQERPVPVVVYKKMLVAGEYSEYESELMWGWGTVGESYTAPIENFISTGFHYEEENENNRRTVIVDPDLRNEVAIFFDRNQYPLEIRNIGEGISSMTTGGGDYLYEEPVTINVKPFTGWEFLNWTLINGSLDGVDLNQQTLSFNMPAEEIKISPNLNHVLYTVSFDSASGTSIESQTYYYDDVLSGLDNAVTTRTGYDFAGWYLSGNLYTSSSKMPAENITLVAKWTPATGTKYKVEYYYQKNGTYSGIATSGEIRTGTTEQPVNVTDKDKIPVVSGYIFDEEEQNILSGNIQGDGSLVLKVYFKQQFTIRYQTGLHGTFTEDVHSNLNYGVKTPIFRGNTGSHESGYTFNGWMPEITDNVTGSVDYVAQWKADTGVKYEVQHRLQNLEGTEYNLSGALTENLSGETDTLLIGEYRNITGFSGNVAISGDERSGKIKGDGSLVLKLYYDRNEYEISTGEIEHGSINGEGGSQKYGKKITFTAHPNIGYVISKRLRDGEEILSGGVVWTGEELEIEVDTGMEIGIDFVARNDIPYYVEYYKENLEGGYDIWTGTYSGTTDQEAKAQEIKFTGFTFNSGDERNVTTGNIDGDGSRVLRLYYNREIYTIKWLNEDGTQMDTTSVKYGEIPTHAIPVQPADAHYTYEFKGWTPEPTFATGETSYRATYDYIVNKYTITWKNDDGSVIDITQVEYGEMPTHVDPTKAETEDYTYEFKGWTPELVSVVGNAEYTAEFNAKEKKDHSKGGNMSGGGGRRSIIDNSKNSDNQHGSAEEDSDLFTGYNDNNSGNKDNEIISLYEWARENEITTMDTLEYANPDGLLTRGHMAKMVVNFAQNVLGKTIPTEYPDKCNWKDKEYERESSKVKEYAKKACALGLMGIYVEEFMPNKVLDRAEFGTIISRLLWGDRYNITDTDHRGYYEDHLRALKKHGILSQTDNPEERRELRKWVWLVFRRISDKLKK